MARPKKAMPEYRYHVSGPIVRLAKLLFHSCPVAPRNSASPLRNQRSGLGTSAHKTERRHRGRATPLVQTEENRHQNERTRRSTRRTLIAERSYALLRRLEWNAGLRIKSVT